MYNCYHGPCSTKYKIKAEDLKWTLNTRVLFDKHFNLFIQIQNVDDCKTIGYQLSQYIKLAFPTPLSSTAAC